MPDRTNDICDELGELWHKWQNNGATAEEFVSALEMTRDVINEEEAEIREITGDAS
jgi:hypothetical protein